LLPAPTPLSMTAPDRLAPAAASPATPPSQPPAPAPSDGPAAEAAVQVRGASVIYPSGHADDLPVHALRDIDLRIEQGEFVSLIGPSGCGKTTLLRVIADLEPISAGEVWVNGLSPHQARLARAYGYVFQAPALFPWRTVLANVMLPLTIQGRPRAEAEAVAREQLTRVGLDGFERKYPWQLSGGMQQRVSIARALGFEPKILMMDEPFGALDEITRDGLNEQLQQLWQRERRTVVFVTHSIAEAVYLSTRIVVMSPRPGRILKVIESSLPDARHLGLRDTPEFMALAHEVRLGLAEGHGADEV
jgi:NitT/TauT family transport system ATP-binding protein